MKKNIFCVAYLYYLHYRRENGTDSNKKWTDHFLTNLSWILPFFQEIFFGFGKKLLHCKQKQIQI